MSPSSEARLILLCGLPGSGKTTLAKRLALEVPAVRLCPDEWMADLGIDLFDERTRNLLERRFWVLCQELLELGQAVILEFGFWARSERNEKRLAARALGVPVELHHLAATVDELCRRLDARNAAGERGVAPVTREMVEAYSTLFEAPTGLELVLPAGGSPRVSAAQLHAGRTGGQPEYARYEGCPPARPARSWIHRYPRRTSGGKH